MSQPLTSDSAFIYAKLCVNKYWYEKDKVKMTHSITIELSDTLFRHLQRASELSQQPIQTIVSQSLAQNIAPLLEDIPEEYQRDVLPLLEMSESELFQEANATFPQALWTVYERLLAKKKEQVLATNECTQLDALRRQADVHMFRKGYAALLLKRRGHQPPTIAELPSPR